MKVITSSGEPMPRKVDGTLESSLIWLQSGSDGGAAARRALNQWPVTGDASQDSSVPSKKFPARKRSHRAGGPSELLTVTLISFVPARNPMPVERVVTRFQFFPSRPRSEIICPFNSTEAERKARREISASVALARKKLRLKTVCSGADQKM